MPTNWTELPANPSGNASCENLLVRGTLNAGAIVGTITPTIPFILDDPRVAGTVLSGTLDLRGLSGLNSATRITFRPTSAGAFSQVIRWLDQTPGLLFSMGDDASAVGGAAGKNFWLFDNTRGLYPLYFPSGAAGDQVGSIRWGGGRVAYDEATDRMTRRVANVIRETLDPTQYVLVSGGVVDIQAGSGMALTGAVGVNIQSGNNATLQAANSTNVIAGADVNVTAGFDVNVSALAAGKDVHVTANTNVDIAAGGIAGSNGTVTIDAASDGSTGITMRTDGTIATLSTLGTTIRGQSVKLTSGTGVTIADAGEKMAAFGVAPVVQQVLPAVPTTIEIRAVLVALGFVAP